MFCDLMLERIDVPTLQQHQFDGSVVQSVSTVQGPYGAVETQPNPPQVIPGFVQGMTHVPTLQQHQFGGSVLHPITQVQRAYGEFKKQTYPFRMIRNFMQELNDVPDSEQHECDGSNLYSDSMDQGTYGTVDTQPYPSLEMSDAPFNGLACQAFHPGEEYQGNEYQDVGEYGDAFGDSFGDEF